MIAIKYILILLNIVLSTKSLKQYKFCTNCKYFINYNKDQKYGKCLQFPSNIDNYLVTGNKLDLEYYYCTTARSSDNMCGVNGTKYEEKDLIK
jgi:hypothetical protein